MSDPFDPSRELRGIVLLDKPAGMTSNRALQRVKRLCGARKAGHTGSLDPLATGMLPVCVGAATKLSQYLLDARKVYRVTGMLGIATDSGDADGAVIERREQMAIAEAQLAGVLERFVGPISQLPPMYSALKHQGRRLYELARAGTEVERKPRTVTIHELHLDAFEWPWISLTVACSKGTYVRTLLTDIAGAIGTVGHVTALRRLSVGPFSEEQMCTLEQLEAARDNGPEALGALVLPAEAALPDWAAVDPGAERVARLRQGARVRAEPDWPAGLVRLETAGAGFFGIGEVLASGELVPRRLL
jgi:tRNA pseudouridine55 synthase